MGKQILGEWLRFAISHSDVKRTACGLLFGLLGVVLIAFSQTASAQDQPIVNVSTVAQLLRRCERPGERGHASSSCSGYLYPERHRPKRGHPVASAPHEACGL